MAELSLRFDSLRAFDPHRLLTQIPAAAVLSAAREIIVERLRSAGSATDVTSRIQSLVRNEPSAAWIAESLQRTTPAQPANPAAVDALLGQIDLGDDSSAAPPKTPRSPIASAVAAAASDGSSVPAEEASTLRRTLADIDRRLTAWLNAVLHASPVQSLEAAWRSLGCLVANTDFRKGVRIAVLHAPSAALIERFRTRLIDPVFDEGADAPDVIAFLHPFTNTAPAMEMLDELAQHAASLPAVALAGAAPMFLGVKNAWQIPTLPPIVNMMDQWQFAKWKSLRAVPHARALGVVLGRALLRPLHTPRDNADPLELAFRESCQSDADLVWCSGAVAAATTISRSVCDTGWPTAMAGMVHGRLEGFAAATGGPKGDKTFGPSDLVLQQPKIEELAVVGFNVLASFREHPDVIVWNGLTAARPHRMDTDALLEVSLPYQLFAGRLSALLFQLKPKLTGRPAESIPDFVTQHLRDWLTVKDAAPTEPIDVRTRPSEDDPKVLELAVTVTPPQAILPGGIPVVMGYKIA